MSSAAHSGGLTLEQKAARLFWIAVHGASGHVAHPENRAVFGVDTPVEVVARHQPGGVVLFTWAGNTEHPAQVAQLTADLRDAAATGALGVAIDEEGGRIRRLPPPATVFPSPRAVAAAADDDLARRRWRAGAVELAAVGVTTNFAPVADLGNPVNPVLGDRTFAEEPRAVAHHAALAVRGLREGGVAAVAKHFPGHGATAVDSHEELPVVPLTRAALEPHLDAFRMLLATEPPAGIMAAHLLVRALDRERPATLSPPILTGILRKELEYEGAIVTDSLSMAGIRTGAGDPEVAVAALAAGADVLLTPPDLSRAVRAVCDAVRGGRLPEQRIDDALLRAVPLSSGNNRDGALSRVGAPEHRAVAADIARRATVVTADPGRRLPLAGARVMVVGASGSGARLLADALRHRGCPAMLLELDPPNGDPLELAALPADATLIAVRRVPELDVPAQEAAFASLTRHRRPVICVETGATPGIWKNGLNNHTVLLTRSACPPALGAAADALLGHRHSDEP